MSAIRLVTFDATRTILQFRRSVFDQYVQTGVKFGIKADTSVINKNFRKEFTRMAQEHPNFGKATGFGWENWWRCMVRGAFKDYIVTKEDEGKLKKITDDLLTAFETADLWVSTEGTEELLNFLKSKDAVLGVVSNFDPRLNLILKDLNLDRYFKFVVTSYEVGFEKPDKRIFEEALRRAGKVGGTPWHVGDNVEADYHGAKLAGWHGLLLNISNTPVSNGVDPSHVFTNFKDLQLYFQRIL